MNSSSKQEDYKMFSTHEAACVQKTVLQNVSSTADAVRIHNMDTEFERDFHPGKKS